MAGYQDADFLYATKNTVILRSAEGASRRTHPGLRQSQRFRESPPREIAVVRRRAFAERPERTLGAVPGDPVQRPDDQDLEPAGLAVVESLLQYPLVLAVLAATPRGLADAVGLGHLVPMVSCEALEVGQLAGGVLMAG